MSKSKVETETSEINRIRFFGNMVAFALLAVVIILLLVLSSSHLDTKNTLSFFQGMKSRIYHNRAVFSNFRDHIGYGGMIHHYKNYQLLGKKEDLRKARSSVALAAEDLKKVTRINMSSDAMAGIITLEKIVEKYTQDLNRIEVLQKQGYSRTQIGKMLQFDGAPALAALRKVDIALDEGQRLHDQKYDKYVQQVYILIPVVLIIIVGAIFFVIWFTRSSIVASKIYSEKFLKQSNAILQKEIEDQTEELKNLNERFELALSGTKDGIWDWDLETDHIFFSTQYKKMLGYDDVEFPNDLEFSKQQIHPDDLPVVLDEIDQHLENPDYPYEVVFRMRHKNGHYRYILSRGATIRSEAGKPYRFVGGHADVTPLKEAEKMIQEQKDLINLIIESLPVGIFAKDVANDYRYVMWNKVLEDIFGAERSEIIGLDDFEVFDKEFGDQMRAIDKSVVEMGEKLDIPNEEVQNWKGETMIAHTIKIPVFDENQEPKLLIGIVEDITEKKGLIEELESHRSNLDELLRKRSEELVVAKEEAEHASQSKSEFLANMSHELRTPMHAIINFNQMAQMAFESENEEKIKKCFDRIDMSAKRLLALLNDLLDLSKYEAAKMELVFANHDLEACIDQAIEELKSLAEKKELTIDLAVETKQHKFVFDRVKLIQVIINILSNAIKVSEPGKAINVRVTEDVQNIYIAVADEGPGIPEEELDTIFSKFVQSSKTNTGAGGTGLGLSICREIMAAHGGAIYAANNEEQPGALFTFSFPKFIEETRQ